MHDDIIDTCHYLLGVNDGVQITYKKTLHCVYQTLLDA